MAGRYDRKTQYFGLVMIVILFILMVFLLVSDLIKTSNYVSVDAVLTNVSESYGNSSRTKMMRYKEAHYTFEYEGKTYHASRPTFFEKDSAAGKELVIKCNPDNPEEIENIAFRGAEMALSVVLVLGFLAVKRSM